MGLENSRSPYDLDEFQRCPKLWDLGRRWYGLRREPTDEPWFNVFTTIGAAVAAGLKVAREKKDWTLVEALALSTVQGRYRANKEWSVKGIMGHVMKGIKLGLESDLGIADLLQVEKKYGHCIPDWVGRDHEGRLRVGDDKTKLRQDDRYLVETVEDFLGSNQLFQGAAEVGEYYGELVHSIAVNLIILTPEPKAECHHLELTPEVMEYWKKGAITDWTTMHRIQVGAVDADPRWSACRDKFHHKCKFWALCHNLAGDESRADALYERRYNADYPRSE